jgi:hypothetical protein
VTDITETIALTKKALHAIEAVGGIATTVPNAYLSALLDAAEAGECARDAALEEAASLADHALQPALAAAIRALRRPR